MAFELLDSILPPFDPLQVNDDVESLVGRWRLVALGAVAVAAALLWLLLRG